MNHEKRKDKNIPRIKENYLVCPVRVDKHDPEVMSHVLMVLSLEPLTTMLGLSGLKETQVTP